MLGAIDRQIRPLSGLQVESLAWGAAGLVALLDYASGYEVSFSFFYLAPVSLAAWYAGRGAAVRVALLSGLSWFGADLLSGHVYTHPAIPYWNAVVRLGIFLVTGLLIAALQASLQRQRALARTDALTGLYGRRAFEERLEHDLALARRHGRPLTLVYVDLDNFKTLNDAQGHAAGDEALRRTARILEGATRRTDTVARLGGDEFALVLPETARAGAEGVVGKARDELRAALSAMSPQLGCSAGVITFREIPESAEAAVRAADALMYRAKQQGKGGVVYEEAGARR
ncbi:MAG TPA: diguanylate cyclase [Burkholderiales bacterium]|nr:diguanylate cyclase [Burkholderiales bacterium]